MGSGICLFGLCLFVYEVVAMALVLWGVMEFGGVMVLGWFSCRRVYGRGRLPFVNVGVCCIGWDNRRERWNYC